MTLMATMTDPLCIVSMAVGGFAGGRVYFAVLRYAADELAARRGWLRPLALSLLRLALAASLFVMAAKLGAAALLAAFLGFLAARAWAVHSARRRPA